MKKSKMGLIMSLVMCFMFVAVVEIVAGLGKDDSKISVRQIKEETVLYTIHRGSYDKIGPKIGNLYALAGKKGINPRGSAYYVYLNNPNQILNQHWLTEIRIPVSKDALKAAGTLGEMSDIKTLPAMEVAVAIKPEGQIDPNTIYAGLYDWILRQGYRQADSPFEKFLTNAMSGNYSMMKTEIMIPIQKLPANTN